MRIDCEGCPNRRGDERCPDCLVDFILRLEEEPDASPGVDADEARALRSLTRAGLVGPGTVIHLDAAG